jgi:hypothetical protein
VPYYLFWKESTANNKEQINKICKENAATTLCMGFYGTKGSKKDPTILSSGVAFLSLYAQCPLVMMKQQLSRKTNPKYYWLICYDGSEKAKFGIEYAKSHSNPSLDSYEIVIVNTPSFKPAPPTVGKEYKITILTASKQTSEEIGKTLVEYSDKMDDITSFLVIGNKGSDSFGHKGDYLGAVAREVIMKAPENIILV